jgi:Ran GTPase-activating protein (RanGAP) involved in mRNA processing and transport
MLVGQGYPMAVEISANQLGVDGAAAFANLLASPACATTSLDVKYNAIGDAGVVFLARSLRENTVLFELHVAECSFGDEGGIALSEMLRHNHTLRVLKLSGNHVGSVGVAAMVRFYIDVLYIYLLIVLYPLFSFQLQAIAIAENPQSALVALDLDGNQTGSAGVALGTMLKCNRTLTELRVTNNHLGSAGVMGLAAGLAHNRTLRILDVIGEGDDETAVLNKAMALSGIEEFNGELRVGS